MYGRIFGTEQSATGFGRANSSRLRAFASSREKKGAREDAKTRRHEEGRTPWMVPQWF